MNTDYVCKECEYHNKNLKKVMEHMKEKHAELQVLASDEETK